MQVLVRINRETGGIPVRSRHCNGESSDIMPLGETGKASEGEEPKSGALLALEKVISYGVLRKALFLYLKYILRRGSFLLQECM